MRRIALVLSIAVCGLSITAADAIAAGKAAHTTVTVTTFTHESPVLTLKHPRRFKVPSEDSYVVFSKLRWRHWGGTRAVARGKATTCDEMGCRSLPTKLVADRRHGCFGEYWTYGRMTAGVVPLYGAGPIELPVEEVPCEKPLTERAAPRTHTEVEISRELLELWEPKDYEHPAGFVVSAPDTEFTFHHIRWTNWGHRRSVGRGRVTVCGEGGIEGRVCKGGRVKLVAGRLNRDCGPTAYYEKLVAKGGVLGPRPLEILVGPIECEEAEP